LNTILSLLNDTYNNLSALPAQMFRCTFRINCCKNETWYHFAHWYIGADALHLPQRTSGNLASASIIFLFLPHNLHVELNKARHKLRLINFPLLKEVMCRLGAVPLQAWSGSEGSRKLVFPDFMTTAQDGGKVVSLTHRPPLPAGNTPGTHFC
jgi:hypothetical protein